MDHFRERIKIEGTRQELRQSNITNPSERYRLLR